MGTHCLASCPQVGGPSVDSERVRVGDRIVRLPSQVGSRDIAIRNRGLECGTDSVSLDAAV